MLQYMVPSFPPYPKKLLLQSPSLPCLFLCLIQEKTMMWMTILVLLLLFIAGLTTNSPPKKFLAWLHTFYVKVCKNHSTQVASNHEAVHFDKNKVEEKRSDYNNKVQLRSVFETFDKNNDGYITKQELRDSLKNIGIVMTENDIADMVKRVDSNGDGLIDLDEFCKSFGSLLSREELNEEEHGRDGNEEVEDREGELKEAFAVFDGDKDGLITVEELGLVLSSLGFKEGKKLEDCKEMIRKVDMDGDGMVNFDEFKKMMNAGQRLVPVS
ncbi:hypothetical protein ACH5RR_005821 [Cinchona calisaya]|uniref:EF-hand domain-containing protein n=1 Tax=Cinchona calisaya TaxID=153742 RepID=A0ABD3AM86_9GENT